MRFIFPVKKKPTPLKKGSETYSARSGIANGVKATPIPRCLWIEQGSYFKQRREVLAKVRSSSSDLSAELAAEWGGKGEENPWSHATQEATPAGCIGHSWHTGKHFTELGRGNLRNLLDFLDTEHQGLRTLCNPRNRIQVLVSSFVRVMVMLLKVLMSGSFGKGFLSGATPAKS